RRWLPTTLGRLLDVGGRSPVSRAAAQPKFGVLFPRIDLGPGPRLRLRLQNTEPQLPKPAAPLPLALLQPGTELRARHTSRLGSHVRITAGTNQTDNAGCDFGRKLGH